jgi:hypothetical protein
VEQGLIGDNIGGGRVTVEVRLFNSITRYAKGAGTTRSLTLPAGTSVGDLAVQLEIPRQALHLVMVNGRDITPGLVGAEVRAEHQLEDGDVVAFSGPVPYSYGYGAPVV